MGGGFQIDTYIVPTVGDGSIFLRSTYPQRDTSTKINFLKLFLKLTRPWLFIHFPNYPSEYMTARVPPVPSPPPYYSRLLAKLLMHHGIKTVLCQNVISFYRVGRQVLTSNCPLLPCCRDLRWSRCWYFCHYCRLSFAAGLLSTGMASFV